MLARIRVTEIFFDIDGAGLIPDGPRLREKPTAFLIHGGPGADHSIFKPIGPMLTERLQVVYFDHRGSGRSARGDPSKYTLDENVEDMETLRRYLGLGPIVSIGASYGGMVAMAHAARYPDAVSHLVLAVTAAHAGHIDRARQLVRERGTPEQIAACEDLYAGRLDTPAKLLRYHEVTGPLYSMKFDAERARDARARLTVSPEALNRGYAPGGCLRSFDLRPELRLIKAPTLIMAGRHDWMCAPEYSEEIHRHIPGSDLRIFEESGHSIFGDEQRQALDVLADFVVYNSLAAAQ